MKRHSIAFGGRIGVVAAGLLAAFGVLSLSPEAPAAVIPALRISVNDHGGGPPEWVDPPGLEVAENRFQYVGTHAPAHGRWRLEWEIDADPDPFLYEVFTVQNDLPTDQEFTVTAVLPISTPIVGGSVTGGSFSGTLLDRTGDGAVLENLSGGSPPPLYMSRIDGADWQPLAPAPQSFTAGAYGTTGFGPFEFGTPIPSLPGPDVLTEIAIVTNVRISAGDEARLAATFVAVPEPATLAFVGLGVAGLLVMRRRRTAP